MRTETATKTNHYFFRALAMLAALALAMSLLTQLARPAEAAFPGGNGNIVFVRSQGGDDEIYRMSKSIFGKEKLTNNSADDFAPAVSPDGSKIAFTSDRDGNYEVYVMGRNGSNQTRLTNNPGVDAQPAFSPDGTKIVFESYRDGEHDLDGNLAPEVYVMDAVDSDGDGNGENPTRLTHDPGGAYDPSYSPDGDEIAFTSTRDHNPEIYVMGANGADAKNLTNHPAYEASPDWSPDGTKIVFASNRADFAESNFDIYVMGANGYKPTNLTNNAGPGLLDLDTEPVFSPDGKSIAFTSHRDGNDEVYRMDSNGLNTKNLTKHPSGDGESSWGPKRGSKSR